MCFYILATRRDCQHEDIALHSAAVSSLHSRARAFAAFGAAKELEKAAQPFPCIQGHGGHKTALNVKRALQGILTSPQSLENHSCMVRQEPIGMAQQQTERPVL